jgi:hypothetical protein
MNNETNYDLIGAIAVGTVCVILLIICWNHSRRLDKAILNDNLVRVCDEGTTNCYMVDPVEFSRAIKE